MPFPERLQKHPGRSGRGILNSPGQSSPRFTLLHVSFPIFDFSHHRPFRVSRTESFPDFFQGGENILFFPEKLEKYKAESILSYSLPFFHIPENPGNTRE